LIHWHRLVFAGDAYLLARSAAQEVDDLLVDKRLGVL
jgi:hypothetical protein